MTEGLDKNRLAITQGFDKMDEVKKWDLQQLPGYEAIEEPEEYEKEPEEYEKEPEEHEKEPEEDEIDLNDGNTEFKILYKYLNFITGLEKYNKEVWAEIKGKDMEELKEKHGFLDQDRYMIEIFDPYKRILTVVDRGGGKEPIKRIVSFNDSDLDNGLFNDGAIKILKNLDLPLPSKIRNEKYKVIKGFQNKAESLLNYYHEKNSPFNAIPILRDIL